jgi:hypothetical protein
MSIPRSLTRMPIQARSFTSSAYNAQKASHAYHIPPTPGAGPSRPTPPPPATRATSEKPILTPEEQQVIDRIVRVDQAGELGANWIYRGQKMGMSIRGDRKAVKQIDVRLLFLFLFLLPMSSLYSVSFDPIADRDKRWSGLMLGNVGKRETSFKRHVNPSNPISSPPNDLLSTMESHGSRSWCWNGFDG